MSSNTVPNIMVFRPTMSEFKNFSLYVNYMESQGAHHAGVAKVIPPVDWIARRSSYDSPSIDGGTLLHPSIQTVGGKQGIYTLKAKPKKPLTVVNYKQLAESPTYAAPQTFDYSELERKYWKNITYGHSIYGADQPGSMTDPDVNVWNIAKLGTILDYVNHDYDLKIEGVNTPYLYFGMWKATFAWHTEDMDLYSINYIHHGSPKTWYAIPPKSGMKFQNLVHNLYDDYSCSAILRHKIVVLSPSVLKSHGIMTNKITQESGEFMITFPYGYHMGFNHGWNIAESTNFATERWVEYGKRARLCSCAENRISFSMDGFVKRFQPEKYELWRKEQDIGPHPEDPTRSYPAPVS